MASTLPEPREVLTDHRWVEGEGYKDELVEYLYLFNNTLTHKLMQDILQKTVRSKFISVSDLKIIEKRFINIPTKELQEPLFHVNKYWKAHTSLAFMLENLKDREAFNKAESLLEFYIRNGYLTKKQIGLITWTGGDTLKMGIAGWLKNPVKETELFKIFKLTLQRFNPDLNLEISEPEQNANPYTLSFYQMYELATVTKEVEEELESAMEIPNTFLSLVDMRKALLYKED